MRIDDPGYRAEIEESATKIQALMRGVSARKRMTRENEALKADIRKHIETERITARFTKEVLVEDGLISSEQAAAAAAGARAVPPPTTSAPPPLSSTGYGRASPRSSVKVTAGDGVHVPPVLSVPVPPVAPFSTAASVPLDLARNIRDTAAKTDKIEAKVNKMAEDHAAMMRQVAEMYKVVMMNRSMPLGGTS